MPVEMVSLEIPEKSGDTIRQKPQAQGKQPYTQKAKRKVAVQTLELNICDSASLEALPGIGPVLSARIIKYRNLLGGFASIDQLKEVYGLSEETFSLISSRVMADPSMIRKISINKAEYRQLIRLPYFEKYEVTAILKFRELKGRINGIGDMVENKLIAEEKAEKLKWYIEF
jgi:DNA uptake protein ComE-like DNA-binding protein